MRILVWGLGYVGTVSAACLAEMGHEVVGVEPNRVKVEAINEAWSAVREPGLNELVSQAVRNGKFRAVQNGTSLLPWADASLICVGTPTEADGNLTLKSVQEVATEIGCGLRGSSKYHVVVLRSTVPPGTTREVIIPLVEQYSGKRAGNDFGAAANPEFLREATAISDFYTPACIVIGQLDDRSGELVGQIYSEINAQTFYVSLDEAEVLKVVNNAFHALKIGFANEVGRFCDRLQIDAYRVMQLVCSDSKLNISPAYLRPGFAFGGSCLPKDLRSLTVTSRRLGLELPILESVIRSNAVHVKSAREKVHQLGVQRIGILGLGFKPGTDDLRESPIIALIRDLWQDGLDVMVYDPDIDPDHMLGSNREYLERQLPQINRILSPTLTHLLNNCDAVVVCQRRQELVDSLNRYRSEIKVLDLVHLTDECSRKVPVYQEVSQ